MKGADTVGRETRGYDAGKKINGRKRFIVTDTLGLLLTVMVCTASRQDRDGAKTILLATYLTTPVRYLFADAGFAGRLVDWAQTVLRTTVEVVRKPAGQPMGGRTLPGLADRTPPPGPRLRTRPRGVRGDDPLGSDQHDDPPPGPRTSRNPPAAAHLPAR